MTNRNIFITLLLILFIILIFYFWFIRKETQESQESPDQELSKKEIYKDYDSDVPKPYLDPDEVLRLWPDLSQKVTDNSEQVKEEWKEFAKLYPNNFYIPADFLNLSSQDLEKRLETMEKFVDLESRFAGIRSRYENEILSPDEEKEILMDKEVTKEDQKLYFDYKVRELESRIQLVEFWLSKGNIDEQQLQIAQDDLDQWNKELQNYKKILEEIQ